VCEIARMVAVCLTGEDGGGVSHRGGWWRCVSQARMVAVCLIGEDGGGVSHRGGWWRCVS